MPSLVRKFDYAKWNQTDTLAGGPASADAITSCMRTMDNKLSLWAITDDSQLEDAVVAIAACQQKVESIDVVSIDPQLIEEKGLFLDQSSGSTPYVGFSRNHRDIVRLNYCSLGQMAEVVVQSICKKRWTRFRRAELKSILKKAVDDGRIRWSELKQGVQKEIPPPETTVPADCPSPLA